MKAYSMSTWKLLFLHLTNSHSTTGVLVFIGNNNITRVDKE